MRAKTEIHHIENGMPLYRTPLPCFFEVVDGDEDLIGSIGYRPQVKEQPVVIMYEAYRAYSDGVENRIKSVKPLMPGSSFTVTITD